MNDNTVTLDQANFGTEVLQDQGVVLVDFWAAWCGPCRAIAPTLEAFAAENRERAKVGKVDVEAHPGLAEAHGVRSIPTLIFFQGGIEVERIVGNTSKGVLQEKLEQLSQAA